jgi:hypothetical protein
MTLDDLFLQQKIINGLFRNFSTMLKVTIDLPSYMYHMRFSTKERSAIFPYSMDSSLLCEDLQDFFLFSRGVEYLPIIRSYMGFVNE